MMWFFAGVVIGALLIVGLALLVAASEAYEERR